MLGVGTGPDGPNEWGGGAEGPVVTPVAARPAVAQANREALAVLLSVHGLGPLTLGRLVDALGSPAAILLVASEAGAPDRLVDASRPAAGEGHAMPLAVAAAIADAAARRELILADVARNGVRVVMLGDTDYPSRLLAIELPPPALFVRGTLAPLVAAGVIAVVGTRRPSPLGRRIASRIGAALARADATVVSGLAVGIDGAAHAAVLAEHGRTVAFIGGGHGRLFPRAHDRLADAIVDGGGAVISEYAPMVEPSRGTFPQRNRLISGASDAVVVVEAGARSGALVTASWALEQGRDCFVVPGSIDAPTSAGCNGFLRDWPGLARVVSGVPQLLDDLGLMGAAAMPRSSGSVREGSIVGSGVTLPSAEAVLAGRDEVERSVGDALIHGVVTVDELVAVTRYPLGAVLRALTRLEASGLAQGRHGRYEPAGALAGASPPGAGSRAA